MTQPINERLRVFFEEKDIKQKEVVGIFGLTKQTINGWFTGSTLISTKHIQDMYGHWPELNYDWLITGRGSMYYKDTELSLMEEPRIKYDRLSRGICVDCIRRDGQIEILAGQLREKDRRIERLLFEVDTLKRSKGSN